MNDETIDRAVPVRRVGLEVRELAAAAGLIALVPLLNAVLVLLVVGLFGLVDLFAGAPAYD